VRLFVALEPPAAVREALAGWARAAVGEDPQLRLVAADALHLTLAFLGERPAEDVTRLAPALARALSGAAPPRDAHALGPLWLAPRRPHVLTVGIADPSGRLAALQARVAGACADAVGWEPEARAFRPHVTVARVRRNERTRPRELAALSPEARAAWSTGGVTLLRSVPGLRAAQYESLWGDG
jgi:RNA 2',3'-cyclic 3'-phosphodiesterase